MSKIFLFIFIFFFFIEKIFSLNNDLGMTPPMGWSTGGKYSCLLNESLIINTIDAIVNKDLKKAGYTYINIDDCWQKGGDKDGFIVPDPSVFPNGIKYVIDYAHKKGLLFGIQSDAGKKTRNGRTGSMGYEDNDAKTYFLWGVDFLKYDYWKNEGYSEKKFSIMKEYIQKTGKPIFYAINDWGVSFPSKWAKKIANSWRTTIDTEDNFQTIMSIADSNNQWWEYAHPGGWNDPGFLVVGEGGMSIEEYKIQMSLWALMKAPLIIGSDVINIKEEYLDILLNPEVIKINQDVLGVQGKKIVSIQEKIDYKENLTGINDLIVTNCNETEYQKWDIKTDGTIRNLRNEICIEISNYSDNNYIQIQTNFCHSDNKTKHNKYKNQLWIYEKNNGIIKLKMNKNRCLSVLDNTSSIVQINNCDNERFLNKWEYNPNSKELKIGNKCLTQSSGYEELEVWGGKLFNGDYAVILLNRGKNEAKMKIKWKDIGFSGKCNVRDLWERKNLGSFINFFEIDVEGHSCFFLRIKEESLLFRRNSKIAFGIIVLLVVICYCYNKRMKNRVREVKNYDPTENTNLYY